MDGSVPHWVEIASLGIALVGGVPGIVTIVDRLRTRAKFRAIVQAWTVGLDTNIEPGVEYTGVLLSVSLTNEGKDPLTPVRFDFWCELDGRKITFRSFIIPERLRLLSAEQEITLESPAKSDLQRFATPINYAMPVEGNLLFVTPHKFLNAFRAGTEPIPAAIICTDVFNRKHSASVTLNRHAPIATPTAFPRQGLKVSPRHQ